MARLASVAVPVPFLEPLTYLVPPGLDPVRGARVLVPLGRRTMTGCVLAVGNDDAAGAPAGRGASGGAPERLKFLLEVVDREPLLPGAVLDLALWVSDYYLCSIGEALGAALPPFVWMESRPSLSLSDAGRARLEALPEGTIERQALEALRRREAIARADLIATLRRARRSRIAGARAIDDALLGLERAGWVKRVHALTGRAQSFRTVRIAAVTALGADPSGDDLLTPRQRSAIGWLRGEPAGVETRELGKHGTTPAVLAGLARKGLVALSRRRVDRDPFEDRPGSDAAAEEREAVRAGAAPTGEQEAALARLIGLAALGEFRVALLHGVTGSGKTEVYRRLARAVRDAGRQVLILVPEIALTPAVAATFRHTFAERVAIQHSGLSDGERHDQWYRIRRGDVDVVVGTRSAVFAPLSAPGLVIVDEEHDTSYKQEETPRYHGRDVAIVRARAAGALVVLGSATPALETYQNALAGRYELMVMTRRVANRPLADVRIVDMREQYASEGPDVVLSGPLRSALGDRLARAEQAIVLLNRRGYASAVFCRQCGGTLECPNCSVSLTVHRAVRQARCHYCGHTVRVPERCVSCGAEYLDYRGVGTERVEAEVSAAFPGARVARVDRDTIRRRGEIVRVLRRFADRQVDVLIGTQMLAKGHDFPAVTLVGVVSADVGLGLADFRAAERTFQLLTQVAGRAGRGDVRGEAIIQTLYPNHYSIRHAKAQDYSAFFAEERAFRQAMRYPPAVSLVNVIVRGSTPREAMADATSLAGAIRLAAPPSLRVLGPAPAPLERLRGEHRVQCFLKGTDRRAMRAALREALVAHARLARRVTVDVDPLSVL